MGLANDALKRFPVGGVVRCARSFYQLLGNRRKFERAPVSGTIFLTTKGTVIDTTRICSCADISPRGMGVDCPESLPVDSFVFVHSEEEGPRRLARVRHAQPRGTSHRIGLEFVAEPQ